MLVLAVLGAALVASPSVNATPAGLPPAVFGSLPNVIQQVLNFGQQIFHKDAEKSIGRFEAKVVNMAAEAVWPRPPHKPIKVNKTIYQVLSEREDFSKLYKLVNLNNATVDLLNNSSSNVTFFAFPNSAIPKPPKRRQPGQEFTMDDDIMISDHSGDDVGDILGDLLHEIDELDAAVDDHNKKDEKRRRIIKHIVGAVLSYHILPNAHDAVELASNTTHATNLTLPDGSLDGKPLRIRIGASLRQSLSVNLFSHIIGPEVFTSNGIVHIVSFPLLPPPAIFTGQFNTPTSFSIATSALQRVGLEDQLDYVYVHEKEKGHSIGAGAVTFFAPSNGAFLRLPSRLRLFLFSPFGHKALKKLLQYHIVPSHVLHSDFIHNATKSSSAFTSCTGFDELLERSPLAGLAQNHSSPFLLGVCLPRSRRRSTDDPEPASHPGLFPSPPVEFNVTFHVPTLLEGNPHTIVVTRFSHAHPIPGPTPAAARTHLFVSGTRVRVADIPARNGAVHIIDRLLNPRYKNHQDVEWTSDYCDVTDGEWKDWAEWLPAWAEEK